jgi:hypothetical protein
MKSTLLAIAASVLTVTGSYASVTIGFNAAFTFTPGDGVSSNFANAAGTVFNGLWCGIIVDTTGNGFLSNYEGVAPSLNARFNLQVGGTFAATDDVLVFCDAKTYDTVGLVEGDGTTVGGPGGLASVAGLDLTGGITQGDAFRVVWFDNSQPWLTTAGSFADAAFVIPADSSAVDIGTPFAGVEPTRVATGILIPETSTALLGALGVLGLLRRRR